MNFTLPGLAGDFRARFGRDPEFACDAGGRVNIIGEHTDYHDGFVFPAAIDLRTWAVGAPRADGTVRVFSANEASEASFPVTELSPPPGKTDWRSYVFGPVWALAQAGAKVTGADVVIGGNVPFGGGLSSSASVEVAMGGLFAAMVGSDIPPQAMAKIARKAENDYCHVPCGIMDQMASACGRAGHALLLDCRSLGIETVPIPESWAIVVADSCVKHSVGAGEYAVRQRQCASGLAKIRAVHPEVRAARDVSTSMLEEMNGALEEIEYRRLRHAVTENDRCLQAREALGRGDAGKVGELLAGSHRSLAGDYEVSCAELDFLVEAAYASPGIIGARLTGAGFGGNTVNLVHAERAGQFRASVEEMYLKRFGRSTITRVVRPSDGVQTARL